MTSPSLGSSISRFRLESHDHTGAFVATLPYKDAQGEWLLNEKGAQLRISVPYRGYSNVTRANLAEGKHELWLYDREISDVNPIFAGPIWDITASSDSGVLNCSAQDAISYFNKRILKASRVFSSTQGADDIVNLITYGAGTSNIVASKQKSNAQTSSKTYKAIERNKILELLQRVSALDDGVEYYSRMINGTHTIYVYGGFIKPNAPLSIALDYGGTLNGYAVQYSAQAIANDWDIIGANGRIGNAVNATKQTEYKAIYQDVDTSDQTASASLNTTAATRLKGTQSSKVIPSLVTKTLTPIKDFDFGAQFPVVIDDEYVQVNQVIRAVGWQLSISQGDGLTTVIYSKDTEGVS